MMEDQRTSIHHIITGLEIGGAEVMLCRFLKHADRTKFNHTVVSLTGKGKLGDQVTESGASLVCLSFHRPTKILGSLRELVGLLRKEKPDLVQMWLTHATVLGSLACLLAGIRSVIWTIHTGNQDASRVKLSIRIMTRLLALFSHVLPQKIVSCSETARIRHVALGYSSKKMEVIPNGTDTEAFSPQKLEARRLLHEAGVPKNKPVVGIVGRWTPEKDHETFFKAALHLQNRLPDTQFVICGPEMDASDERVSGFMALSTNPECFHFLGSRSDMPQLYSGLTLLALTSVSEGFPLVLGEAMACGVPCVATNVGDSELIVGQTGIITRTGIPESISQAWERLLTLTEEDYASYSENARRRVVDHFSIQQCVASYERLYEDLPLASQQKSPASSLSSLATDETAVTQSLKH